MQHTKRGRPPRPERTTRRTITLPDDLWERVREAAPNPKAHSAWIEEAVREKLAKMR